MMVTIEITKEYKSCWKKGAVADVSPGFARTLIELGYAKALSKPPKNKMIEAAEKEK